MNRAQVHAYLRRLGVARPAWPTIDVLPGPHLRHLQTVPFENLWIQGAAGRYFASSVRCSPRGAVGVPGPVRDRADLGAGRADRVTVAGEVWPTMAR